MSSAAEVYSASYVVIFVTVELKIQASSAPNFQLGLIKLGKVNEKM